jgi:hypothetical protein
LGPSRGKDGVGVFAMCDQPITVEGDPLAHVLVLMLANP